MTKIEDMTDENCILYDQIRLFIPVFCMSGFSECVTMTG